MRRNPFRYVADWLRLLYEVGKSLPALLAYATTVVTIGTPFVLEVLQDMAEGAGWDTTLIAHQVTVWSSRILAGLALAGQLYIRVTRVAEDLQGVGPVPLDIYRRFQEGPGGP